MSAAMIDKVDVNFILVRRDVNVTLWYDGNGNEIQTRTQQRIKTDSNIQI